MSEESKQQKCISILQTNVTISIQAQSVALQESNNTSKSLQDMRGFLKIMSAVTHKGKLIVEILEDGTEEYIYLLDYGTSTPKRFHSKCIATLSVQISLFGEHIRREGRKKNE